MDLTSSLPLLSQPPLDRQLQQLPLTPLPTCGFCLALELLGVEATQGLCEVWGPGRHWVGEGGVVHKR